jgi:glycosyltransferase involved in cell wall biosynthesis
LTVPSITVCVFAWDEVETLGAFLDELRATLERLAEPWEVIVIDDGSTDGSGALADAKAAETPGMRVIHHPTNEGLGGVYRTGFREARGEVLTFFPGDAQFPASIIEALFPRMATTDMVLGYIPKRPDDVLGRSLSVVERVLYRVLLGKLPRFQGVFMLRRNVLERVPLVSQGRGWAIVMELILRVSRAGYRTTSIATAYRARTAGRSKVNNIRSIEANLRQLLALKQLIADHPTPPRMRSERP